MQAIASESAPLESSATAVASGFVDVLVLASMEGPTSLIVVVAMILVSKFASSGLCLKQDIYAPSYVDPCSDTSSGCAWDVFKNGSTLVVINPDSGPGNSSHSGYVNLVDTVKSEDSTVRMVLGYVSTNYTFRDSAMVQADIDLYYSFYKVDGIFLDEGPTTCDDATITKYKSYDNQVKAKGGLGFTVLNWGTQGPQCYLDNTNINTYVTYEGYFNNYTSEGVPSEYMTTFDFTRFWNILHSAPTDATAVQAAVTLSKSRNVGHIYITDDSPLADDNPYDTAPSMTVWEAEKTGMIPI